MDLQDILTQSAKYWDGGYVMCGLMGHGDAFALRDPNAIRPAYYYKDDEIVVVASERPVIQTSFNVNIEDVKEIKRGHALIIKKDGTVGRKTSPRAIRKRSLFVLSVFIFQEEMMPEFIMKD